MLDVWSIYCIMTCFHQTLTGIQGQNCLLNFDIEAFRVAWMWPEMEEGSLTLTAKTFEPLWSQICGFPVKATGWGNMLLQYYVFQVTSAVSLGCVAWCCMEAISYPGLTQGKSITPSALGQALAPQGKKYPLPPMITSPHLILPHPHLFVSIPGLAFCLPLRQFNTHHATLNVYLPLAFIHSPFLTVSAIWGHIHICFRINFMSVSAQSDRTH